MGGGGGGGAEGYDVHILECDAPRHGSDRSNTNLRRSDACLGMLASFARQTPGACREGPAAGT